MRLQKDNVQRVVESEVMIEQMTRDGWVEVDENQEKSLEEMSIKELKTVATEKGIEFNAKTKKEELLALLQQGLEGEE